MVAYTSSVRGLCGRSPATIPMTFAAWPSIHGQHICTECWGKAQDILHGPSSVRKPSDIRNNKEREG